MRKLPLLTLTLAMLSASYALAQESYGYGFSGGAFGGHGGLDGAFRYGIGGEARLAPLVTAGGEIGGISQNGTGVLASGNVSVHIPAPRSIDPFVTGGFSVGHKGETGLWVNLGGGVNYWFQHRLAFVGNFADTLAVKTSAASPNSASGLRSGSLDPARHREPEAITRQSP